jgi:hypothetical protein
MLKIEILIRFHERISIGSSISHFISHFIEVYLKSHTA